MKSKKELINGFLDDLRKNQESMANYIGSQTIKKKAEELGEAIDRLEVKLRDFDKACKEVELGALLTLSESKKGVVNQEPTLREKEFLVIDEKPGIDWPINGDFEVYSTTLKAMEFKRLKKPGDQYVFHSHRPGEEYSGTHITTTLVSIR